MEVHVKPLQPLHVTDAVIVPKDLDRYVTFGAMVMDHDACGLERA